MPVDSPNPARPAEAIAWHRKRLPLTKQAFAALTTKARREAFTVAGAATVQLVADVQEAVARALRDGTDLEAFKAVVGESLTAAWVGTKTDPATRLETIFRTTTQTAYNAGRYAQATDPDTAVARPYWQFDAVVDGRTTSGCKMANGVILPSNDSWWEQNFPPRHFQCFPPGTHVLTERGSLPIEQVSPGDRVVTHRGRLARVYTTYKTRSPNELVEISLSGGGALLGTRAHPALTNRGWVKLADLRPGDRVVCVLPLSGLGHRVPNGQGLEPGLAKRPDALDWNTVDGLGNLNDEVEGRDKEVCEVERIANDHRLLWLALQPVTPQPLGDLQLGNGWLDSGLRVRGRIGAVLGFPLPDGTGHHVGLCQPLALGQFGGGRGDAGVRFLGMAKGPVLTGLGSPEHHGAHRGTRFLAPGLVVDPLDGDGIAALAQGNTVLAHQSTDGCHAGRLEDRQHLPQRLLLGDVEVAQVGADVDHSSLDESGFDSLVGHTAQGMATLETVKATRLVFSAYPFVFNLGVEDDETYVANGIVVHNCRATFHPLRASYAERLGITTRPPPVVADEGFGTPPT